MHHSIRGVVLLTACAGPVGPGVGYTVPAMSDNQQRRAEQLDSADARPGDQDVRRPLPPEAAAVEKTAATAAAILGVLFSTSRNAWVGVGGPVDEDRIVDPAHARRQDERDERDRKPDPEPAYDPGQLVPWIKLDSEPAPAR